MNEMTRLLNKIERRLGFKAIKLPEAISKDTWCEEIIAEDTIPTFSRFFPHCHTIFLGKYTPRDKFGYYLISEEMVDGAKILGFKDIDWQRFSQPTLSGAAYASLGIYDEINSMSDYTFEDVGLTQCTLDLNSVFNTQIVPDFQQPNRVRFMMSGQRIYEIPYEHVPVEILVEHPLNLMTIPPTMMETFEELAIADVAAGCYEYLKYFDGLETVFTSVDLKMDDLRQKADKRDDIINTLKESYISPSNKNQPIIMTI